MLSVEHRQPLAAFVLVSVVTAAMLGGSLRNNELADMFAGVIGSAMQRAVVATPLVGPLIDGPLVGGRVLTPLPPAQPTPPERAASPGSPEDSAASTPTTLPTSSRPPALGGRGGERDGDRTGGGRGPQPAPAEQAGDGSRGPDRPTSEPAVPGVGAPALPAPALPHPDRVTPGRETPGGGASGRAGGGSKPVGGGRTSQQRSSDRDPARPESGRTAAATEVGRGVSQPAGSTRSTAGAGKVRGDGPSRDRAPGRR